MEDGGGMTNAGQLIADTAARLWAVGRITTAAEATMNHSCCILEYSGLSLFHHFVGVRQVYSRYIAAVTLYSVYRYGIHAVDTDV